MVSIQIHWLSFTIHDDHRKASRVFQNLFQDLVGALSPLGHGGRGYRSIENAALEIKVYSIPISSDQEHFHIEIPGSACEAITVKRWFKIGNYLSSNFSEIHNFTRLDLAFDDVGFEPSDVEQALIEGKARTLAKRESIRSLSSPFQEQDNGKLGTQTVELGSIKSDRMITVYNKRGFTRLEYQMKGERSDLVAKELLTADPKEWYSLALSHLLDFVDFDTEWWTEFKNTQGRANKTVSSAKQVTTERLVNWIDGQVSPALSALEDAYPGQLIPKIIERGRRKRGKKYDAIFLEDHEKTE